MIIRTVYIAYHYSEDDFHGFGWVTAITDEPDFLTEDGVKRLSKLIMSANYSKEHITDPSNIVVINWKSRIMFWRSIWETLKGVLPT